MNWRAHLKPEEGQRLVELAGDKRNAAKEIRRIKDRCWHRAKKSGAVPSNTWE